MKYWFKRRRYGYGWIPVSWQGWLVLSVYVLVVVGGAYSLESANPNPAMVNRDAGFYLLFVLLATIALLRIALQTGPKPKWRWGTKPDDNPDEDF